MVAVVLRASPPQAPAVATTRLSSQSRRGPMRSQERRRRRSGFWTICQDRRRRSRQDIPSIGASLLRRLPKDIATICEDNRDDRPDIQSRRNLCGVAQDIATICEIAQSAKDIRSIGADSAAVVQKYRDELRSQPATIARSDVAALFQPVEAQYAGEATETSPQRNDCYTYARTVASASRESITMVARYHHLAIQIAQFGHDLTLTSGRATGGGRMRNAIEAGKILGRKSWDANLGMNVCVRSQR